MPFNPASLRVGHTNSGVCQVMQMLGKQETGGPGGCAPPARLRRPERWQPGMRDGLAERSELLEGDPS